MFKIEAKSFFDKLGGLSIGILRGLLVSSLLLAFFMTTSSEYLVRNVKGSYLSSRVAPLAPSVYKFVFKGFVSKYFPNEKMNQEIFGSEDAIQKNQERI